MRVAVGQFASVDDGEANLAIVDRLLDRAANAGASLVVLPEYAMEPSGPADAPPAPGQPLDGPFVRALHAQAAAHRLTVVAGMTETRPPHPTDGPSLPYNTVVVVGPDGLRGRYRKVHLFDAYGWQESARLTAGDPGDLLVLPVGELTLGVATCYDLRFPEIIRALVDRGADLLAVPAAWVAGPLKEAQWTALLAARAIENTSWVVAAAQPPPEHCGRSAVVDPLGVTVAALGAADESLLVTEITADAVQAARRVVPVLRNRRFYVDARSAAPRTGPADAPRLTHPG